MIEQLPETDYYHVSITSPLLGVDQTLYLQCPGQWTWNQLKCHLLSYNPQLKFHLFMISLAGKVPDHQTKILESLQPLKQNGKKLSLFLTQHVGQNPLKFQEYYVSKVKIFAQYIDEQCESIGLKPEQQISYLPIMNRKFESMLQSIGTNTYFALQQRAERQEVRQNNRGGFHLSLFQRCIIVVSIALTAMSQATILQMMVITLLLVLHFVVGNRRGNRVNQNQQNRTQKDKRPSNRIYKKIKYCGAIVVQFIYVYFMSLFPNWNIQQHYLERFKQKIKQYEQEFKKGDELKEPENRKQSFQEQQQQIKELDNLEQENQQLIEKIQ